ncbi:MAG: hypothetical protein EOP83_01380 [Verrucomicrobiaceae bacterium]|nr:MAG: hypothetical protein EOP83_01380 [Verrucomicrobiaceae bacterium]
MSAFSEIARLVRREIHIWQGKLHRKAVYDPLSKRVFAVGELDAQKDGSYWAWVRKTFPHAVTVDRTPYDEEMHNWFKDTGVGVWTMRRTMFRAQIAVDYADSVVLTNVFFFVDPNDAFHFRMRYGGKVGNHYDIHWGE